MCRALNIVHLHSDINSRPPIRSKEELKNMYPECFSGKGTFKDYKYHIKLDPKVKPVLHPSRKIALSLQPYDITFKYILGWKVPVAEALKDRIEIKGLDITTHDVTTTLNHVQVEAILNATGEDQVLQLLIRQMMQGWLDHIKQLPVVLKPFLAVKR